MKFRSLLITLSLASVISGCGIGPGRPEAPQSPPAAKPSTSGPAATTKPQGSVPPGVPDDLGEPVATRRFTSAAHGVEAELRLYPLRKAGETTRLYGVLTLIKNPTNAPLSTAWLISGDRTYDGTGVPSGFWIIDPDHRELIYPDYRPGTGQSACSPVFWDSLTPGTRYWIVCKLATPQADRVDVATRAFGVIPDVPVIPGAAPAPVPSPKPTTAGVVGPDNESPSEPARRPLPLLVEDALGLAGIDARPLETTTTLNANIAFGKDDATLKPEAVNRLKEVAASLQKQPPGPLSVKGYTDNLGTHEHGVQLSQARAKAVRGVLEPLLPGFQLTDEGRAEADPVAPNDSEENRAKNRRVEIRYTAPKTAQTSTPTPSTPSAAPASATEIRKELPNEDGSKVMIESGVLRRRGSFTQLDLTVSRQDNSTSGQFNNILSSQSAVSGASSSTNGVRLVDPVTKQRYVSSAASPGGFCLPMDLTLLATVYADTRMDVHCYFAATDAQRLELQLDRHGTIATLPVN